MSYPQKASPVVPGAGQAETRSRRRIPSFYEKKIREIPVKNIPIGEIRFFREQLFVFQKSLWITRDFHFILMAIFGVFRLLQCYKTVTQYGKKPGIMRFCIFNIVFFYIAPFGERGQPNQNWQKLVFSW